MTAADWEMKSRAERDAVYNNTAVANSAAHGARWTTDSDGMAAYREHLDIPYAAKERTNWDLYPAPEADAPCLIHITGVIWPADRSFSATGPRAAISPLLDHPCVSACGLRPGLHASFEAIDSVGSRVSLKPVEGEAQFTNAGGLGD